MEVVVAAHTHAVTDARRSLRDVILEHAPELLDLQDQHAAEAEQARSEMEQRHAAERAEQDAREQQVRLEATTVLNEMPNDCLWSIVQPTVRFQTRDPASSRQPAVGRAAQSGPPSTAGTVDLSV